MGIFKRIKKIGLGSLDGIIESIETSPKIAKRLAYAEKKSLVKSLENLKKVLYTYEAKTQTYLTDISKCESSIVEYRDYAKKANEKKNNEDLKCIFIKLESYKSRIDHLNKMVLKSKEFTDKFSVKVAKMQNQVDQIDSVIVEIVAYADGIEFNKKLASLSSEDISIDSTSLTSLLSKLKEQGYVSDKMSESSEENYEEKYEKSSSAFEDFKKSL